MKILDVITSPWAIQPEKLGEISEIYSTHLRGDKIDLSSVEAKLGHALDNPEQGYEVIDGVALIPMNGVVAKKMNMFSKISGGASTELIGRDIKNAMNDEEVESVILVIDSPGGTVDGTADLGDVVYQSRGSKPIVAFADGLMASAAYWVGSAADSIVISSPTTTVGSIGVVTQHVDQSQFNKKEGIVVTDIYAGKFKRMSSENKPLSKEGKAEIQSQVDYLYSIFVETVARNRNVSVQTVLDDMADGRMFIGQQAIDAGLVDKSSTLEGLIAELSSSTETYSVNLSGDSINADNQNHKEIQMEITKSYILENHPEIAESFVNEGKASVDVTQVAADAADGERSRIQGVFDQTMTGHEGLISTLAFDGKTTGPEAAVQILQAEKALSGKVKSDLEADAGEVANISASVDEPTFDENIPVKDRCKATWEGSAKVRAEFNDDFASYLAFSKATESGQVKILKGGK